MTISNGIDLQYGNGNGYENYSIVKRQHNIDNIDDIKYSYQTCYRQIETKTTAVKA